MTPTGRVKLRQRRQLTRLALISVGLLSITYVSSYLYLRDRSDHNANNTVSVTFLYGESSRYYALSEYAQAGLEWSRDYISENPVENWPGLAIEGSNWVYTTPADKPTHLWRIYRPLEEIELLIFPPN